MGREASIGRIGLSGGGNAGAIGPDLPGVAVLGGPIGGGAGGGFGGGPGGSSVASAASPFGSSPVTPPIFASRFGPQIGENRFNLPVGSSSGWRAYEVDRPTILWAGNAIITGPIFYSAKQPVCNSISGGISIPTLAVGGSPVSSDAVQTSTRHGICYLSGPGKWWLFNGGTTSQEMLAIDASDPNVALRYMSEPGSAKWTNGAKVNVTVASTQILQENRARGATIITHTGLDSLGGAFTLPVWISFEAAAAVGQGLALLAGNTIALTGELNYRGRIRGIISAGANGCDVAVQDVTS